jgi:hypothetical protein
MHHLLTRILVCCLTTPHQLQGRGEVA